MDTQVHPDPEEPQMHRGTEDTRAGSTEHIVRYVLMISLVLILAAMTIVYLWGTN